MKALQKTGNEITNAMAGTNCKSFKEMDLSGGYSEFSFEAKSANKTISKMLDDTDFYLISSDTNGQAICAGTARDCQSALNYYVANHPSDEIKLVTSHESFPHECAS